MPPTVPCPSCGAALAPGAGRCGQCGLPLTGPPAAELWEVDRQLALLRERRAVLLETLRDMRPPGPDAPPPVVIGPLSAAPPLGPGAGRRPAPAAWPAQQVLLAVGALLVVVAASVFLAVSWAAIGVAGQVAVMAGVTLLAGAGSLLLLRRGLRASAEALAVLAVALALVDAAAARWLDLAGLSAVDPVRYAAWVAAGLALVLLAVSPPLLRPSPVTFRLAAVLATAAAPLLALVAVELSAVAATAACAVVAALAGWASRRLPQGWRHYRRPAAAVFGGYLVLTWLLAPASAVDQQLLGEGGLTLLVGLVLAGGAGWAAGLPHGLRRAFGAHPVLAVATLLGGAVQAVALAGQGGLDWVALLAVVAALVTAVLAAGDGELATSRRGVLAAASALLCGGALLVAALGVVVAGPGSATAGLTAALAAACCAAAVVAVRRPRWRDWSSGTAAATGAAAVAAATAGLGLPDQAYAVGAAAAVLVGVTAALRPRLELVVGGVAVLTALVAVVLAALAPLTAAGLPPLAPVLAGLGLLALAYGIRPERGRVAWAGVLLSSAGNAVRLSAGDVAVVEAYTLPLAGLALVVGLVRLRRRPGSPSWLTVGPAVSAGLLPSAVATIGDPALVRPVVVLLVAVAVMVAGIALHWQAPFLTGALAAGVVAVAQLAPYAVGLPRWVSFGSIGLVLLVLGAGYEQRRRNASEAVRWVGALR